MEVLNKPETPGTPPPDNRKPGKVKQEFPRPKKPLWALILGRAAFVIVGTMFVTMTIFSVLTLIITANEPYLAPNIVDDQLHQDKIYIQIDGENFYRELVVIRDQPADPEDREVTQIPAGKAFRIIFTPKQASAPEEYQIHYRDSAKTIENKTLEQGLERRASRNREGDFDVIYVDAINNKWQTTRYLIQAPDSGMFGGTLFAYFTIYDPAVTTPTPAAK